MNYSDHLLKISPFQSNDWGRSFYLFINLFTYLVLLMHMILYLVPTHVSFFVWTATWEKILTGDILWCRGFNFVDWCIMCHCNGETVNHLLLHCEKAYQLWSLVFRSFGISWVLPRSVADTPFGWWNWFGKHSSSIWNLTPLCLMWCIWRERNWRTFEAGDKSDDQLLANFSGSLFDWSRAWGLTSSDSIPMFLSSLLCN